MIGSEHSIDICKSVKISIGTVVKFVPDHLKTKKMCKHVVTKLSSIIMCNKAIDDFLPALKIVPDWFVTSQIKKLTAFNADDTLF